MVTLWTLLPPPAVGVTPPVRIETSSAAVTEGQTLDLNCMVAGQGHPQVTWYRRGGALPPNSQVGHGGGGFALQATTLHLVLMCPQLVTSPGVRDPPAPCPSGSGRFRGVRVPGDPGERHPGGICHCHSAQQCQQLLQ